MPDEIKQIFNEKLKRKRIVHTIIIFFLGLYFYQNMSNIKENVNKFIDKQDETINENLLKSLGIVEKTSFSYYWFMICFFHDFAYTAVSKIEVYEGNLFGKSDFDEAKMAVEYTIETMKQNPISVPLSIVACWKNYIKYRQDCSNSEKIDHGIFAGAYFFHNRLSEYNKLKYIYNNNDFIDKSTGLVWSNLILEHIQQEVAWAIIAHNVWYASKNEDRKIYRKYKLDELIIDKPLVSIYDYPLYYLLVSIDTLDFYKFYDKLKLNPIEALDDVKLKIIDGNLLSVKLQKKVLLNYEKLINDAKVWLCLDVSIKDESVIDIQFR